MALTANQITAKNFKKFYQALEPYLSGGVHGGFTPVGSIIAVMGNDAPTNYLKCDGSIYSIADYPELANYFEEQFDNANFFGGDGATTFAVPDLRGEFLRGTGTNSHTNQGSGDDVGVHQDGSEITEVISNSGGNIVIAYNGWTQGSKEDSITQRGVGYASASTSKTSTTNYASKKTVRPTNTSVLYCIAIKNIYLDVADFGEEVDENDIKEIIGSNMPSARQNFIEYSTDEQVVGKWIDNRPIYQKTFDCGALPNNTTKRIAHNVTDFDFVIDMRGIATNTSTHISRELDMISTVQASNSVSLSCGRTNIELSTGTNGSAYNQTYVTLKYVKTTD